MGKILQTARQYERITAACRSFMPSWFSWCSVLRLEDGELLIGAPNQTLAARVRQYAVQLRSGLAEKGIPVSSVRLKVTFERPPVEQEKPVRSRRLSQKARASFEALYKNLADENANPELMESLRQMLENR